MADIDLLKELGPKDSRGSKARCHLFTHGERADVARFLERLTNGVAQVAATDLWMPSGFAQKAEVELHKRNELIDVERQALLAKWWLPQQYLARKSPNFDIASTCTIDGELLRRVHAAAPKLPQ
jgi:hypothetical protein